MLAAAVLGTTACGSAANVFSETEKTTADTQQESQDNSEAEEVDAFMRIFVTLIYWVRLNGSDPSTSKATTKTSLIRKQY